MHASLFLLIAILYAGSEYQKTAEQAPPPRPVETLDDLVRTIGDKPDPLHRELTPSVHKLIELGDPAIPRMLDLMLAEDRTTRLRASHVLRCIVMRQHGFIDGQGWKDDASEKRFRAFWKSLGNL
ncbi:MAG TPA: hypothetical protein VLM40_22315, partial [Gemmata sp.]|nr:hypothetical protein [Gemmata sp.]